MAEGNNSKSSLALRLQWFLASSWIGRAVEILDLILSFLFCCFYVAGTYDPAQPALRLLTLACLGFFSLEFLLAIAIAPHALSFLLSTSSILDLIGFLPVIPLVNTSISHEARSFLMFPCVLRIFHLERLSRTVQSDINKQLFKIGFTVTCITFVTAAVIEVVENIPSWWFADTPMEKRVRISFSDCYWFVLVTVATIGYGDLVPKTNAGRLTVMAMMASALLTIPKLTNKLVAMLAKQSAYERKSFNANSGAEHILVCGALGSSTSSGPRCSLLTAVCLSFGPMEKYFMFSVT